MDVEVAFRPGVGTGTQPRLHGRHRLQCLVDAFLRQLEVLQRAGEVALVGRQVEVAVAGEVEEDHRGSSLLPGLEGLVDGHLMAWSGSGAGRMPSARANWTPASKVATWWTARASMMPFST